MNKDFQIFGNSKKLSNQKEAFSTTFQFRKPGCKFSRADRFSPRRFSVGGEFRTLPGSIGSGRKTSFGYGKRYEFKNPGGFDAPPCNTYNIKSCFDQITGGVDSRESKERYSRQNACYSKLETLPAYFSAGKSKTKAKFSTDASSCFNSIERHSTPGPRKLSLS